MKQFGLSILHYLPSLDFSQWLTWQRVRAESRKRPHLCNNRSLSDHSAGSCLSLERTPVNAPASLVPLSPASASVGPEALPSPWPPLQLQAVGAFGPERQGRRAVRPADMQIDSKETRAYLTLGHWGPHSRAALITVYLPSSILLALRSRRSRFRGHSKMSLQAQLLCLLVMGFQSKHASCC